MAAGIAALEELRGQVGQASCLTERAGSLSHSGADAFAHLEQLGVQLEAGMKDAAKAAKVPVQFNRCGSMFCAYFTGRPVHNLADAMTSDRKRFASFFHGMLAEGIYLAPSQFEAGFISTAHSEADVEKTADTAAKSIKNLH